MKKHNKVKIPYSVRFGHERKRKATHPRREQRRIEAAQHQAEYNALSIAEKIARCLEQPGFSARQMMRLLTLAEQERKT